jgi:hypothetical protein
VKRGPNLKEVIVLDNKLREIREQVEIMRSMSYENAQYLFDTIKRLIDELEQTIRMGQRNTLILAGERDKYRIEARQERELTANIVAERETLIIENERLISLLRQKEEESKRLIESTGYDDGFMICPNCGRIKADS